MNKPIIIMTLLMLSGSAYGRHYNNTQGNLRQQIADLQQQINQREREIQRIQGKTRRKKSAKLQELELAKESSVEEKQMEIQDLRRQLANMQAQVQ